MNFLNRFTGGDAEESPWLSRDAFRTRVLSELQAEDAAVGLQETFDYGLILTHPAAGTVTVNLERFYAFYREDPAQLDRCVEIVLSMLQTSEIYSLSRPFAEVQSFIMPVLMPRAQVERYMEGDKEPAHAHAFPSVSMVFFMDFPDAETRILLARKHVDDWGITLDDLGRTAMGNLAQSAPVEIHTVPAQGMTIFAMGPEDNYNASRILLQPVFTRIAQKVNDDLLIVIPDRQTLVAAPISDQKAVHTLMNLVEANYSQSMYPVSDKPFIFQASDGELYEANATRA